MTKVTVKPARNKSHSVIDEIFSGLNNHDIEDIVSPFLEEASLVFPGYNSLGGFYLGKKKVRKFFQRLFLLVPDIHFTIKNVLQSDRNIVVEWVSTGITKKGIPYANNGVSFLEMENGCVKEMRLYLDTEKFKNP